MAQVNKRNTESVSRVLEREAKALGDPNTTALQLLTCG